MRVRLALCSRPGLPGKWPTLVLEGEVPEGICTDLAPWPIQTITLENAIRAAGGLLYQ